MAFDAKYTDRQRSAIGLALRRGSTRRVQAWAGDGLLSDGEGALAPFAVSERVIQRIGQRQRETDRLARFEELSTNEALALMLRRVLRLVEQWTTELTASDVSEASLRDLRSLIDTLRLAVAPARALAHVRVSGAPPPRAAAMLDEISAES
jgi:hypothetical protein